MTEYDFHSEFPAAEESSRRQLEAAELLRQAEYAFAGEEFAAAAANWQLILESYDDIFAGQEQRKRNVQYNLALCYIFMSDLVDERAFELVRRFTEDEFALGVDDPELEADLRELHKIMTGAVEAGGE